MPSTRALARVLVLVRVLLVPAVAILAAAAVVPAADDGDANVLVRVARRGVDDLARLTGAGLGVVLELNDRLYLETPRGSLAAIEALGLAPEVVDTDAGRGDYLHVGLRDDSDLAAVYAAGIVVDAADNWVLLRVSRLAPSALEAARVHVARVPHRPLLAPSTGPEPPRRSAGGAGPANPLIQKMVNAVLWTDVNRYWTDLTVNAPTGTRYSLAPGCRDAGTYCRDQMAAARVPAEFQNWSASHGPNVIGTHPGAITPEKVYIVIGHLDDLPSSGPAPGADDNASGSVNVLASAKVLGCWPFRSTVKFIACTGEEQGLLGSDAYAADALVRGEDIRGVINMDMIAWQGDGSPNPENLDVNFNGPSQFLGELFAQSAADYATGLSVDAFYCPSLTASDHASFWERGWPAICGITDNEGYCGHGGNYPYYHQSTDTIANCGNTAFFHAVIKTSVATLATLAEPFKITFARPVAACDGTVRVVLGDWDLDTNPAAAESVTVDVWSTSEPEPERIVLLEQGVDTLLFAADVPTTTGPAVSGDGRLTIAPGDTVTARYVDALDCDGSLAVPYTATIPVDCVAPVVSGVQVASVSDTQATIAWTTDELSDSSVVFGPQKPPGSTSSNAAAVTSHSVALSGLAPCTTYWYEVRSADAAGNAGASDNGGAWFRFETLAAGTLQSCHQGRVMLARPAVACTDSVSVTVSDMDENGDPNVAETIAVGLTSSTERAPEALVLTETGPNTSEFRGVLPVATGPPSPADGVLQVTSADLLTATYRDADDGSGGPAIAYATADVDCSGPAFPSVAVESITDETAVVTLTTSEPTTATIEWGASAALGTTQSDAVLATTHSFTLQPLAECGRYFFRLRATDAYGNASVHDRDGVPLEFNASKIPGIIFRDAFEGTQTWTLEGEWQVGPPQAKGTPEPDPASAFEGTRVLGHDLTGLGLFPGNYETNKTERAISPSINASALAHATLNFRRWLNTSSRSTASVEVLKNGTWHQVWRSSTFGQSESQWSEQSIDISTYADGNAGLRVLFKQQGGAGSGVTRSGWNIDRLNIRDGSLPAFDACGTCAGVPSFRGAASARDAAPCAAGGLEVRWDAAVAWGTGREGTYAVYRDTAAGFVPSAASLVAAGVSGTSFTDTSAPSGVTVYYIVRAESDQSNCGGPNNGGAVDANLVRVATRDETSQPPAGSVGESLRVATVGAAHVRLAWDAAAGAARYHVLRSAMASAGFAQLADVPGTSFEDRGEATVPATRYYLVRGVDLCGSEGP